MCSAFRQRVPCTPVAMKRRTRKRCPRPRGRRKRRALRTFRRADVTQTQATLWTGDGEGKAQAWGEYAQHITQLVAELSCSVRVVFEFFVKTYKLNSYVHRPSLTQNTEIGQTLQVRIENGETPKTHEDQGLPRFRAPEAAAAYNDTWAICAKNKMWSPLCLDCDYKICGL